MDLQALRDFNLVALHGGFGRAGRATGRPKATLSRKVGELEQSLGVRLVERGTRTLRLTDEGLALHEATRGPLQDIAEAELAVGASATKPRGRLRISAPVVLSHVALAPVAADFARAYPEVEVEIVAEDRKADPVEDGFDIVIRVNPAPDERLVGRRILEDEQVLVGPAGAALPKSDEIEAITLGTMRPGAVWRVVTDSGRRTFHPHPRLRFSSFLMVREGVIAGGGFALVPGLMVAGDVAAGRLRRFGIADGPKAEIWALQNSRRLASRKVRLFLEALARAFGA